MNTAKHVLRYLKGTIDHKLCFKKSSQPLSLLAYSDSDWGSSVEDRRSTTGYCFSLTGDGPLVSWKSKKQPTVALSTCEAEYMALAATTQESLYLTQLLNGMDKKIYHCTNILEDNQGAISLSKDPVHRQRSKHIDVKYHFIRTMVNESKVNVKVNVWKRENMKTMRDFLVWYNNRDVEPFVEALQKMTEFYKERGIC
ncbi:hypothetical protein BSL78_14108 [Apostichopus japonicus]|uniref:Retrovirus-related Pol polyprotein from transposon TNT 1-94 n=1 Tax=Stichopus japonicus TaxID=307972 RepID=A0A2G8KLW8_STIJA|nr:hypothetical protein BSL78_14108 [Apostichopus japonicus]